VVHRNPHRTAFSQLAGPWSAAAAQHSAQRVDGAAVGQLQRLARAPERIAQTGEIDDFQLHGGVADAVRRGNAPDRAGVFAART
jgi:hypothetical protein